MLYRWYNATVGRLWCIKSLWSIDNDPALLVSDLGSQADVDFLSFSDDTVRVPEFQLSVANSRSFQSSFANEKSIPNAGKAADKENRAVGITLEQSLW